MSWIGYAIGAAVAAGAAYATYRGLASVTQGAQKAADAVTQGAQKAADAVTHGLQKAADAVTQGVADAAANALYTPVELTPRGAAYANGPWWQSLGLPDAKTAAAWRAAGKPGSVPGDVEATRRGIAAWLAGGQTVNPAAATVDQSIVDPACDASTQSCSPPPDQAISGG